MAIETRSPCLPRREVKDRAEHPNATLEDLTWQALLYRTGADGEEVWHAAYGPRGLALQARLAAASTTAAAAPAVCAAGKREETKPDVTPAIRELASQPMIDVPRVDHVRDWLPDARSRTADPVESPR